VSTFTVAWIVWTLAGVLVEVVALRRSNPGDTLSENIRAVVDRNSATRVAGLTVWLGFALWFAFHIFA